MSDVLVFIPAWNEESNLPGVLEELAAELPDADVLVIDDGSTDATAEVARSPGGRVDADGQHPASELRRLIEEVSAGRCDVAVGSRYLGGEGYESSRYRLEGVRRLGTALVRRSIAVGLRRPFHDPMSGMYAVGAGATELLSRPYTSEAPEVEALLRVTEAGLRLEEVPVHMRPRQHGESKLQGRKALGIVVTVAATLLLGRRILKRRG